MKFFYYLSLFFILIKISFVDYKSCQIPFRYNLCLGLLGILRGLYLQENPIQYVAGFCFMFCLLGGMYVCSRGNFIGGGDVKLMSAAGLLLGFQKVTYALFLGCLFALIFQGKKRQKGNKSKIFPMGPYLCLGIFCQIIA